MGRELKAKTQSSHSIRSGLYRVAVSFELGEEVKRTGLFLWGGGEGACLPFGFDCISHIKLKQSVTCECCDE